MIKKFLNGLFGKSTAVAEKTDGAKPHPSSPESSKTKTKQASRPEHADNKKQPDNSKQPQKKHQKNDRRENSGSSKQQENRNHKKDNHRNKQHRNESSKPAPVTASQPEEGWEPEKIPQVEGVNFYGLGLSSAVLHGIADLGFEQCSEIQSSTLPEALKGRDIAGKAQTGTGKTAAFLISVFDFFVKNPIEKPEATCPRCLIIAPTRELAVQIGKDARELGKYCDAKVVSVFGGMDYKKQADELDGRVDILVATPGRLIDYARRKVVDLRKVEILVIDEADRMLDMGFIPDVRRIIGRLPGPDKRITQLYSATLSDSVMNLAKQWMKKDYHIVEIDPETVVAEDVEQVVYMVTADQKIPIIMWYLNNEDVQRMMIFTNRRDESNDLSRELFEYGVELELLTGDVPQKKRMKILERFRSGELKVIVATDVAGRGIHVDDVSHVINYELPYEAEDYVHRVGRTGRAGTQGRAISFACENSAFELPSIEEYIGHGLKCTTPETEMLQKVEKVREAPKREKKHSGNRGGGGRGRGGNRGGNNRGRSQNRNRR